MPDTAQVIPAEAWESIYVPRYGQRTVGLQVHVGGVLVDADATPTVTMTRLADNAQVASRPADHPAPGTYEFTNSSVESEAPGFYAVAWSYTVGGVAQAYQSYLEVGASSPAYDALEDDMRDIVEEVWIKLADAFDSPYGGPNLQVYYQTKFGRGRLAQLLRTALGTLNTAAQPFQTYTLDSSGKKFPTANWGPLLAQALYIETLKHLRRSYLEQPRAEGVNVARTDRTDYFARWGEILNDEMPQFTEQMQNFKIASMELGGVSVLIAGGVYGEYAPTRIVGSAASRPRYWAVFH